jgi:hypothetical protein
MKKPGGHFVMADLNAYLHGRYAVVTPARIVLGVSVATDRVAKETGMRIGGTRLAQACVMAALAAGCSGGEAPAENGPARPAAASEVRDACALITGAEASAILGSPVTATPRSTSSSRSVCDYVPAGGPDAKSFQSFTLEALWSGAEEEIEIARRSARTAAQAAGGEQDAVVAEVMGLYRVEGLGDEAYFSRRTMSYVRKGDVLLVFHVAGLDEPGRQNWEALSRTALGRL